MSDSSSIKSSPNSISPVAVKSPSKATLNPVKNIAIRMSITPGKPSIIPGSPKPYLMERTMLLGAILDAFKEHDFWTLRALNDRFKQPEQYLLWNLETIAVLHEGGEHDGTYELMPEVQEWMYYDNCHEGYYQYIL
ncbi:hypothetical protein N7G274_006563 [Stereocaulon virgatum]|uniref:TFIIF beta subunit HTH domain-containing protein n=1 Tax=Stereocaulon virgatum TaxID=373712 RepID=A0ABR4A510_9LECA